MSFSFYLSMFSVCYVGFRDLDAPDGTKTGVFNVMEGKTQSSRLRRNFKGGYTTDKGPTNTGTQPKVKGVPLSEPAKLFL
jgi:hypothetical protein